MSSAPEQPPRKRRTRGPDPIANDRRAARRRHELGENPACAFCGEDRAPALTRVSRALLEKHHVSGRANDPDLTVLLCLNCHACVTEGQRRLGVDLRHDEQRTLLDRLQGARQSQAAFDRERAASGQREARKIVALAERLDRECPDWRSWEEAC